MGGEGHACQGWGDADGREGGFDALWEVWRKLEVMLRFVGTCGKERGNGVNS